MALVIWFDQVITMANFLWTLSLKRKLYLHISLGEMQSRQLYSPEEMSRSLPDFILGVSVDLNKDTTSLYHVVCLAFLHHFRWSSFIIIKPDGYMQNVLFQVMETPLLTVILFTLQSYENQHEWTFSWLIIIVLLVCYS